MTTCRGIRLILLLALAVVGVAPVATSAASVASPPAEALAPSNTLYLPIIRKPLACPATSGRSYGSGIMYQFDNDNPVRPAWNHADKNLDLRGYSLTTGTKGLIDVGRDAGETAQPPQLKTLFSPARVPTFPNVYRVNNWNWGTSPAPGTRGTPITNPGVTLISMQTTAGEELHAPTHGRNIGDDFGQGGSMVIYADANSIAIHYTREDTAANGYTVHVDNICTDPNLLALYNSLDNAARNTYSSSRPYGYNLPGLTAGKVFGTARSGEIFVALVDSGAFMDPRSCKEFWFWEVPAGGPCP
jgi:hypothetical protein